ncbi:LuxR C-terminal-related transcriptional regulator [Streptomyces sp. JV176]|uniref:LuxR C-terminal-related transcriptional regulator n=1 Tax=Streptomyces sp. JV176 TaxID=858630 RepID=UPI002E791F5A|nr:LuxR C-terminal-related transcriptional regulator [Streptomyces sp. JV176]MEE1799957.1 LuxR C-terminal-related transcriptional regulator [Streptomyces sp. JV176]
MTAASNAYRGAGPGACPDHATTPFPRTSPPPHMPPPLLSHPSPFPAPFPAPLEREAALDLLAVEAGRALDGSGRLVVFRGPTGTGRSTLLEAAADLGAQLGMRVLRAHASADGAGGPLALVRQLLCPPADFGPDDGIAGAASSAGLWRRLCAYAEQQPLLVAVDDVHLADRSSRRWLTEGARRMAGLRVLMVVTERGQYDIAPPSPGLAHALPPAVVGSHALAPLSRAAAEKLIRGGADAPAVSAEWVEGCVRAGAGNPLLLRALLDDLRAVFPDTDQGAGHGVRLPASCAELYPGAFVAAVSWWLESAGPGTATVARTLAELEDAQADADTHHPVPEDDLGSLLAEVTWADPSRVAGWLTAMVRLGVLRRDPVHGGPRFAHPLLREAVLDGWPRSHRQAVHRRAAELRRRRGDRARAVAAHLLRTPPDGTAWVPQTLLDAASVSAREGRTADAVACLRRALDEPLPRERRAAVLAELGALEFTTVRSAGISRLAEALRLQEAPRERVLTAVTLGTALAHRGEPRAAFDVLGGLGTLEDEPVLARTVQSASALLSDHDPEIRREVYARLRETAARSPERMSPAVRTLLIRYEATAGLISADWATRQIRRLLTAPEDPLLVPYLLGTAAAVAQWADAPDDAERLVRAGLTEHRLSSLHPIHGSLLNVRVDIAAGRGQYARVLEETAGAAPPPEDTPRAGPSNFLAQRMLALVEFGRTAEAGRLAEGVDVSEAHDSWELNRFLYARGVLRAATGDPAGALADFLECGRRQLGRNVESPIVTPWRSAAAECHLALGQPQEALALAEVEHRYATVWNTPRVRGRALRVQGAATGGRHGLELTGEAVDTLRNTPLDTELVHALVAHGRQLTSAGRPGRARPLLREAAATAERLAAPRLLATAEAALLASGARRRNAPLTGTPSLTASERRIAALAADGSTNAEISELLHLAKRTVETHLTSTYRKLGIRRRADLKTALAPVPAHPTETR